MYDVVQQKRFVHEKQMTGKSGLGMKRQNGGGTNIFTNLVFGQSAVGEIFDEIFGRKKKLPYLCG